MTLTSSKSVRTLFWEGLAIILSILLTFAIDAWWEEQGQRVEETKVLKSLTTEFEVNLKEANLIISTRVHIFA